MNVSPLFFRRPLGCLKTTSLRQAARQQKVFRRTLATAATEQQQPASFSDHNFYRITDKKTKKIRTAFAIYEPLAAPEVTPSTPLKALPLKPPHHDPMPALQAAQIARMDPTGARTALFAKTRGAARVGDVLMVTHRRGGEPFAGVCLSIRRAGIDTAILLRNHMAKVGVEMWYKIYNKNVAGIEIVKRRAKRARRARLTYMRKPKHDMGSVDSIVFAWRKTRKVLTTRGGGGNKGAAQKGAAAKKK
ncbi:translation protein SH3-like domain-containing protein [Diplogelasinospora grovesii]|uniref:Translation protein SH3-like domain-containing protein n=1 Tax=Diplogelasinospora grovesii TaxID=303347 RepID=A0AAN6NCV4_9PEZI|nr:translation protein SH3-like domain-containing protein [Diplogelasinospora grovesii]